MTCFFQTNGSDLLQAFFSDLSERFACFEDTTSISIARCLTVRTRTRYTVRLTSLQISTHRSDLFDYA